MSRPARAVLLDVDGTLVDTNYLHVIAWQRAFRDVAGIEQPGWRLHRAVGKGGDRYVAAVAGDAVEQRCGDAYLDLLNARELLDGWTTSADVSTSKPAPDLVEAALARVSARPAVLVGDTIWDAEAAAEAGIGFVAVLSGGIAAAELTDAGALAVYENLMELRAGLDAALATSE